MPVKLFVQTGDARPKCVARVWGAGMGAIGRWSLTAVHERAVAAADRWWLVECENADEGRRVITGLCHSMDCALLRDDSHEASCDCGRILASGGKETL